MTFNYDTIGGVMQDLHPDFVKDVKALLAVLPANLKEYDKLFTTATLSHATVWRA